MSRSTVSVSCVSCIVLMLKKYSPNLAFIQALAAMHAAPVGKNELGPVSQNAQHDRA